MSAKTVVEVAETGDQSTVMTESVILDDFDHRLLALVRRDNLQPARVLGEAVGLSESAVLRRLRRLRATGVIAADIAVVDLARLARTITVQVLVKMEREGVMTAFAARLKNRPEILGAWQVTGGTDFLLMIAVPSMEAYETFCSQVLTDHTQVRSFETLVVLREIVRPDPQRARLAP